jgi:hypothetical protein
MNRATWKPIHRTIRIQQTIIKTKKIHPSRTMINIARLHQSSLIAVACVVKREITNPKHYVNSAINVNYAASPIAIALHMSFVNRRQNILPKHFLICRPINIYHLLISISQLSTPQIIDCINLVNKHVFLLQYHPMSDTMQENDIEVQVTSKRVYRHWQFYICPALCLTILLSVSVPIIHYDFVVLKEKYPAYTFVITQNNITKTDPNPPYYASGDVIFEYIGSNFTTTCQKTLVWDESNEQTALTTLQRIYPLKNPVTFYTDDIHQNNSCQWDYDDSFGGWILFCVFIIISSIVYFMLKFTFICRETPKNLENLCCEYYHYRYKCCVVCQVCVVPDE